MNIKNTFVYILPLVIVYFTEYEMVKDGQGMVYGCGTMAQCKASLYCRNPYAAYAERVDS